VEEATNKHLPHLWIVVALSVCQCNLEGEEEEKKKSAAQANVSKGRHPSYVYVLGIVRGYEKGNGNRSFETIKPEGSLACFATFTGPLSSSHTSDIRVSI
jgi:hypothetical protein